MSDLYNICESTLDTRCHGDEFTLYDAIHALVHYVAGSDALSTAETLVLTPLTAITEPVQNTSK